MGLDFLTDTVQEKARMVQKELLKQHPQNEVRFQEDYKQLIHFLEALDHIFYFSAVLSRKIVWNAITVEQKFEMGDDNLADFFSNV